VKLRELADGWRVTVEGLTVHQVAVDMEGTVLDRWPTRQWAKAAGREAERLIAGGQPEAAQYLDGVAAPFRTWKGPS